MLIQGRFYWKIHVRVYCSPLSTFVNKKNPHKLAYQQVKCVKLRSKTSTSTTPSYF